MQIVINTVAFNKSLVDGPGIRTLVFMQGCDLHCKGCQNQSTWDITKGESVDVDELVEFLKSHMMNNKITITGGEPLMQIEALRELLKKLKGMDIALYTGHQKEEVPEDLFQYLTYLKAGPFVEKLKSSTIPYVGSSNQKFMKVGDLNETK